MKLGFLNVYAPKGVPDASGGPFNA